MERARLLKEARSDIGWSQEYVAEQVGVNRITVQRWASGETFPQQHHLKRLCKLFGKTAQELGLVDETAPGVSPSVKTTVLPQVNDTYTAFQGNDLSMRLQTLVWSWLLCRNNARYHGLQTAIALALELKDNNSMN